MEDIIGKKKFEKNDKLKELPRIIICLLTTITELQLCYQGTDTMPATKIPRIKNFASKKNLKDPPERGQAGIRISPLAAFTLIST